MLQNFFNQVAMILSAYVAHCLQTITFPKGILYDFQNSQKDRCSFCSPEEQHVNYCFGLSLHLYLAEI